MTSVFDQYEQSTIKPRASTQHSTLDMDQMACYGLQWEPEQPIFTRLKKDFHAVDRITHACICNRQLVAIMGNNVLFRMNLNNATQRDEIALDKYITASRLTNLFLDPTGNHVLITLVPKDTSGEHKLLYLNQKSVKLKGPLRLRDHEVTAVAWSPINQSTSCTGAILLGTSKGMIFETKIHNESEKLFMPVLEQYCQQIFDIAKPITDLAYFVIASDNPNINSVSATVAKTNPISPVDTSGIVPSRYVIFVCTAVPLRLYCYVGDSGEYCGDEASRPILEQLFQPKYLKVPEEDTFVLFQDVSSASHKRYSRLRFWSETHQFIATPTFLVWLTEHGLMYASLSGAIFERNGNIIGYLKTKSKYLDFPKPQFEDYSSFSKVPVNIALSQFHALLAYHDSIKAICLLNNELVYEDNVIEANDGKLVSIMNDPITNKVWAVTGKSLYRLHVCHEERNVWPILCEAGQFELAKRYTGGGSIDGTSTNDIYYNQVLIKEAEYYFNQGAYIKSAELYGETRAPFEEVVLKYVTLATPSTEYFVSNVEGSNNSSDNPTNALMVFLRKKLSKLPSTAKTQITMLVLWLVELYASQLEQMRLFHEDDSDQFRALQKDFQAFTSLPSVAECIRRNRATFYDVIASHGDKSNLIKLAIIHKDFEQLILQHIQKDNYTDALMVLKSQTNWELYYQFAAIFLQHVPEDYVKAAIEQGSRLVPLKLLPALAASAFASHTLSNRDESSKPVTSNALNAVIVYAEFCVYEMKVTESAIHNFLLSLYVHAANTPKLMQYLKKCGDEPTMVPYDVYFTLKICQEVGMTEACVHLSAMLGLWEDAVEMALSFDQELAKKLADMPTVGGGNDDELRKKLWLQIAKHIIGRTNDIGEAMEFVKQCTSKNLIGIEDVLPFCPDFITIDHFRSAISEALATYNSDIEQLKSDMADATQSAQALRRDIADVRDRCTFIANQAMCDLCGCGLLNAAFYVFPCQHRFHMDCLITTVMSTLPADDEKYQQLQRLRKHLGGVPRKDPKSVLNARAKIDNIIATECYFCGDSYIEMVDRPFVPPNNYQRVREQWL